ncbi:MAG: hypothetical protein JWO33_220 [Caulobacteraceae bacterium]|nr:hypothetical protein [Caulobacteraceae bacterium]
MSPTRRMGLSSMWAAARSPPALGARRALAPSVGKAPGAMLLSRMPLPPHSTASDWVMAAMPALDMADGTVNGPPFQIQVTRMETTEAAFFSAIQRLPASSVTRNPPRKTMLEMASKPLAERSSVRLMKLPAALLIRPVSAPPSAQMASIMAEMASASRMSQGTPTHLPPWAAISSAAVASSTPPRRPQI